MIIKVKRKEASSLARREKMGIFMNSLIIQRVKLSGLNSNNNKVGDVYARYKN